MGQERRRYPRVPLPMQLRYRNYNVFTDIWNVGTIVDLSAGGLRLSTTEPVEPESKLQFEISLTMRKDPIVLTGRVVWEKPVGKGSECGVEFTGIAPEVQSEIDRLVELMGHKRT